MSLPAVVPGTQAGKTDHTFPTFLPAVRQGYGAFTYSRSHIDNVYKYIQNQEEHHKKITFREEYIDFLEKYDVPYDERFLFEFL